MNPHMEKALSLLSGGQTGKALAIFEALLMENPSSVELLLPAGRAYLRAGMHERGCELLGRARGLSPGNPQIHLEYARALLSCGNHAGAAEHFAAQVEKHPNSADALFGLGSALRGLGSMREAALAYEQSARLRPGFFGAHFNAGLAYYSCRDFAKAADCFGKAIALNGDDAQANRFFGVCRHASGDSGAAATFLRKAVALDPRCDGAWYDLGNVHRDCTSPSEALDCYTRALDISPGYLEAAANMAELLQATGKIQQALHVNRTLCAAHPGSGLVVSNTLLCLNYFSGADKQEVFDEHRRLAGACYEPAASIAAPPAMYPAHSPVRVGYVSADFVQHSVGYFIDGILSNHNRGGFEVYCYANNEHEDSRTREFRTKAAWRSIYGVSDDEAAACIRNDRIDVLVDLSGHTAGNRLGIFARCPAPVQATYCGYPNTTGLKTVGYRLTDPVADPEGSRRWYTETLVRLTPCFLCYTPPASVPAPETGAVSKRGRIVLGSFNNIAKISDDTVDAWSRILSLLPGSQLRLKYRYLDNSDVAADILGRFERRGVDPRRILCAGRTPSLNGHLSAYNQIDIALDTFPYNGTTTTCEAMLMGVPVVVLAGDRHAGRVGASLCAAAGVQECITGSVGEYVERVVEMAGDRDRIAAYRHSLRGRLLASPLCDCAAFTRGLEKAYREMLNDR